MALSRRKVLYMAVCASCHEAGFLSAEEAVIETLTVMMQTLISEIGRTSQLFAEHNGRCEVTPNDVFIALIEMGLNVKSILDFANNRSVIFRIPTPGREPPQKQPTILHIDQTRPLHSYIPSYFPPFPDAHSYIRTPTQRQPISEYEAIRDKAASQKRDLEKALTRYLARTCESGPEHSLFANNASLNKMFPLISIKPSNMSSIDALLPKDQIFNDDEEEEDATYGDNTRGVSVIVKGEPRDNNVTKVKT
jgi:transcription initiation factor TFIID subunit 8